MTCDKLPLYVGLQADIKLYWYNIYSMACCLCCADLNVIVFGAGDEDINLNQN